MLVVKNTCTDGKRRQQGLLDKGQTPTSIDAAGSFAHQSAAKRGFYLTRSGRVHGRFQTKVRQLRRDRRQRERNDRVHLRSKRFDCSSGPVAYTIYRDGTPQAPFSDAVISTGLYTATGKGVTARMRTLAPGRTLVRGEIN